MASYTWPNDLANVPVYPTAGDFPPADSVMVGQLAIALDTNTLYISDGTTWLPIASPGPSIAITGLTGDVSATGPGVATATVNSVGGKTAAEIAASVDKVTTDVGGRNFGDSAVVFQPGGVASGSTYTDWNTLYNNIFPLGLAAVTVTFDNSFAPIVIPAGTYFLTNVIFQAPIGTAISNPVTITLSDGVVFTGFPGVSTLITMVSESTAPIFTVPATGGYVIALQNLGRLASTTGAPMIVVPDGAGLAVVLLAFSSISGSSGFPLIEMQGTSSMIVIMSESTTIGDYTFSGPATAQIGISIENPNVSISTNQPDFLGTINRTYNPLISNITVGTGLGDIVYSNATGQGTTLPADTSDQRVFLSGQSIGGAPQAPQWLPITPVDLPTGDLTAPGTDGLIVTGGLGAVIGGGTQITQTQSGSTTSGYLSSTDWNTFNSKQPALTIGNLVNSGPSGLTVTNGLGAVIGTGTTLSLQVANAVQNGYLSATDWVTFNSKQNALTFGNLTAPSPAGITITNGVGAVIGTGTAVNQQVANSTQNGYLSATDWVTFNSKQPLLPNFTTGQVLYGDGTNVPITSPNFTFNGTNQLTVLGAVSSNSLLLNGTTSGTISILPQAVAGTYNFNMPTTAGLVGQVLTSQGGAGAPMTWTSSGGGGGSLIWIEGLDSPTPIFENNIEVYGYDATLGQQIFTTVKVPASYTAGNPVTLLGLVYSAGTTGTLLFQTQSTLIRTGIDPVTSTTNQRTSTNTALTLAAGTVNIPQAVSFDISSTIGQINAVNIAPGDLILIRLFRGTDTSTVQGKALLFAGEIKFTP